MVFEAKAIEKIVFSNEQLTVIGAKYEAIIAAGCTGWEPKTTQTDRGP